MIKYLFATVLSLLPLITIANCDEYFSEEYIQNRCGCPPLFCVFAGVEGGYQEFYQLPNFSYGQLLDLVTPIPFLNFDDEAEGPYVEGSLGVALSPFYTPRFLGLTSLTLAGRYFSDCKETSFNSPITGVFAFIDNSGDAIAIVGLDGKAKRDYQFWGGDLTLKSKYFFGINRIPLSATPYIQYGVYRFQQNYKIDLNSLTGPLVNMDFNEVVKTTYHDFGLGGKLTCYFFPNISIFGKAGYYFSYASSKFNGSETFTTPLGSAVIEDTLKGWHTKVKTKVGLSYEYRRWLLELVGSFEYWNYIPAVKNPTAFEAGFAIPASLESSFAAFYTLGGKISVLF